MRFSSEPWRSAPCSKYQEHRHTRKSYRDCPLDLYRAEFLHLQGLLRYQQPAVQSSTEKSHPGAGCQLQPNFGQECPQQEYRQPPVTVKARPQLLRQEPHRRYFWPLSLVLAIPQQAALQAQLLRVLAPPALQQTLG